jgi:hypothetical protein
MTNLDGTWLFEKFKETEEAKQYSIRVSDSFELKDFIKDMFYATLQAFNNAISRTDPRRLALTVNSKKHTESSSSSSAPPKSQITPLPSTRSQNMYFHFNPRSSPTSNSEESCLIDMHSDGWKVLGDGQTSIVRLGRVDKVVDGRVVWVKAAIKSIDMYKDKELVDQMLNEANILHYLNQQSNINCVPKLLYAGTYLTAF